MEVTTHPLETLDDESRQQIIEALAGDGPDLGILLTELARVALAQGKTQLANHLFNSALYQEDARGRSGGAIAVACLTALSETALALDDRHAQHWAKRLKMVAPDDETRKAADRLIRRAQRKSRTQPGSGPQPLMPPAIGNHPLTVFETVEPGLTFADVGGMGSAKQALERVAILPYKHPESAKRFGIVSGGGVLLYGPPGCGKTLLARAAAGEMGVPIISVKASEILHPLYGMAERNLAQAFKTAREKAPCVLFIDELDGISRSRELDFLHLSLVNPLLVEIDSTQNGGVLIIAATNNIDGIDPAVLRPGRFDKLVEVREPDPAGREAIWRINLAKYPCAEGLDAGLLVELSDGLSGADIAEVAKSAAEAVWMQSLHEGADRTIGMGDLLIALSQGGFVDGAARNRIDEMLAEDLLRGIEE